MTSATDFNLFENEEYLSCVFYNEVSNKWRVRSTAGVTRGISFGEYPTRKEATEVGKQVKNLTTKSDAYRLRTKLGINGRGAFARDQRKVLKRDAARLRASEELVTFTVKVPRNELHKLLSA